MISILEKPKIEGKRGAVLLMLSSWQKQKYNSTGTQSSLEWPAVNFVSSSGILFNETNLKYI